MLILKICRNKRGGLFLCNSGTVYNKIQDVWTDCIGHPNSKLYPEVTFENSPIEVELVIKKLGMNLKDIHKKLINAHHEIAMESIKKLKEENCKLKAKNDRLLGIIESLTKKSRT